MMAEPSELVRERTDPGPRFERLPEIPERKQFEQGVGLYHEGSISRHASISEHASRPPGVAAQIVHQAFLGKYPSESRPCVRPLDIIDQYKTLMREARNRRMKNGPPGASAMSIASKGWFQRRLLIGMRFPCRKSTRLMPAMLGLAYVQRGFKIGREHPNLRSRIERRTVDPTLLVSASQAKPTVSIGWAG